MSSIRIVQTERLLESISRNLYGRGVEPTTAEWLGAVAKHFNENPAGLPLQFPLSNGILGTKSNAKEFEQFIQDTKVNIEVLYETMLRQLERSMDLMGSLNEDMSRLQKYRRQLMSLVDDYLLSTLNAEGYFYAISDSFAALDKVDLNLTSAQLDLERGQVTLPALPYSSSMVSPNEYGSVSINVTTNGQSVAYNNISSFNDAIQSSLDNTYWVYEVESDEQIELVSQVDVSLEGEPEISEITFTPYGMSDVQIAIFVRVDGEYRSFGNKAVTTSDKVTFVDQALKVSGIRFILRKSSYDYVDERNANTKYRYIFGARSIVSVKNVYDYDAQLVSKPLYILEELKEDTLIDAVSLEVDETSPAGTRTKYFVGASNGESDEEISDISWREITPVNFDSTGTKVVRFDGANPVHRIAREEPTDVSDIQLIPKKTSGPVSERNPSPEMIPAVDVYRIAKINSAGVSTSYKMTEGLNTLRVYSKPIEPNLLFSDVDILYWSSRFNASETTVDYARIDAGNDFFYGGDVGASGQDIYLETFLSSDIDYKTFLSQFVKTDARSRTWDVKAYLNGREIGYLPAGTDKAQLPWTIRKGLNHVVLIVRIPGDSSNAFLGTLSLMKDDELFKYGLVHLQEWKYVDPFEMRYNERGTNNATFTVIDGEIVSRRKPTDNMKISYILPTGDAPEFIRLRVDMERNKNSSSLTPILREYRIRFAYGD